MNETIKKLTNQVKNLWAKWTWMQRIILVGIVVVAIVGIIALFGVSASPNLVAVIDHPIRDQVDLDRIVRRINQEDVRIYISSSGIIQVADENTARRMRGILISEDLIPRNVDPWRVFDRERWTNTDFERNVNFQRAQVQMITDHIRALDDIDNAIVNITFPPNPNNVPLFLSDRSPITAAVTIFPKHGSDITQNRRKIEGIQSLLKLSVMGLQDQYITINDSAGQRLNNFEDFAALDRLNVIERENRFILGQEEEYRTKILRALQSTYSTDRVRDLNIKLTIDMSQKTVESEYFEPFILKPSTPGLPYDDGERQSSVTRSRTESRTTWEGRGFNPEGPAGVEGQTPPAFRDMDNVFGRMEQETLTHNEEINRRTTREESSPQISRVTVSVNIDGVWKIKRDDKGRPVIASDGSIEREYTPIPPEQIRDAEMLIRNGIGFLNMRGDSVSVLNIPFERTAEHAAEDAAYFRQKQIQTTIVVILSGLTLLLVGFIIFRIIAREMERRRRLAEEERARREQALRESAMADAEAGLDVSISVEERSRMELMDSVTNLAKEHPEDCAQLIRTWILEE